MHDQCLITPFHNLFSLRAGSLVWTGSRNRARETRRQAENEAEDRRVQKVVHGSSGYLGALARKLGSLAHTRPTLGRPHRRHTASRRTPHQHLRADRNGEEQEHHDNEILDPDQVAAREASQE